MKREAFYWLAIRFTFALGTAVGDLAAVRFNLGFVNSLVLFTVLIAIVAVAYYGLRLNAVVSFWGAYVLTRPLGASLGDYLSQPTPDGGLGWGTTATSLVVLATILALVVFLTIMGRDRTPQAAA